MKKFAVNIMALGLLAFGANQVFAADIPDVSSDYWAAKEINEVVDSNIMALQNGKFNPEGSVARVDFVQALLKLLSNDNLNVKIQNSFTDVKASDATYGAILRSQQLGLVYGYPDRTFKPAKLMTRSETQSVVSHITKDMNADASVLTRFSDEEEIPGWARGPWAKTLNYGIFVNYPRPSELRPNDILSRAEEAVILARLKDKIGLVKDEYKGPELLGVEHLNVSKKAPNNEVKILSDGNLLQEGNVIAIAFDEKFKSDEAQAVDSVYFVADNAVSALYHYTRIDFVLQYPCNRAGRPQPVIFAGIRIVVLQSFFLFVGFGVRLSHLIKPFGNPHFAVPLIHKPMINAFHNFRCFFIYQ